MKTPQKGRKQECCPQHTRERERDVKRTRYGFPRPNKKKQKTKSSQSPPRDTRTINSCILLIAYFNSIELYQSIVSITIIASINSPLYLLIVLKLCTAVAWIAPPQQLCKCSSSDSATRDFYIFSRLEPKRFMSLLPKTTASSSGPAPSLDSASATIARPRVPTGIWIKN